MPEIADGSVVPDDHLEGMLSPNWVGDCELNAWGPNGWLLTSEKGLRKASHSASFVSFLGVAYVAHVGKNDHRLTVPISSHVDDRAVGSRWWMANEQPTSRPLASWDSRRCKSLWQLAHRWERPPGAGRTPT